MCAAVRYSQGQDAKLLFSGSVSLDGPCLVAMSPNAQTVAISGQSSVVFWDAVALKEQDTLQKLHSGWCGVCMSVQNILCIQGIQVHCRKDIN